MRLRVCAFVILIFLVIVLFPTLGQSSQQVVVAFSEFPPYKMMVDDRPAGIDVEILKEVAKRMDLALSFKQATFEECMRMMQRKFLHIPSRRWTTFSAKAAMYTQVLILDHYPFGLFQCLRNK